MFACTFETQCFKFKVLFYSFIEKLKQPFRQHDLKKMSVLLKTQNNFFKFMSMKWC